LAGITFLAHSPSPALAKSRGQLLNELEQKQKSIDEARAAMRQAEATRKAAVEDIAALDQKIDALEQDLARVEKDRDRVAAELDQTRTILQKLKADIEKKRAQLAKAEEDLSAQQARLNARAASIYKGGEVSYVEVLLSTERLVDLVNRLDLLTKLMEQDENVLGQIKRLRAQVQAEKEALQAEEAQQAQVEAQQAEQARKLNGLVAERESKLDSLDDAKAEKQRVADKAAQDKVLWEKQEDELLRESAGIAAELRKLSSSSGGGPVVRGSGQMIMPVAGRLSSRFGYRTHPISGVRKLHTGLDIAAPSGTPIKAADDGTVVFAGWRGGYGKTLIVSHGNGLATLYAHQSALLVGSGARVGKGQVIGRVGSTGYSTGPHLHFEVRKNGSPVDPLSYL
jgi:murein DD-endopeptidase MepM/ murein hydrolase activator NlpD